MKRSIVVGLICLIIGIGIGLQLNKNSSEQLISKEELLKKNSSAKLSPVLDNYNYTKSAENLALKGYKLYQEKKYANAWNGGHYTDPIPNHGSYEFWTNGKKVLLDRDSNGHHETIFEIKNGQLIYIGSLGKKGVYIDVAPGNEKLIGKYRDTFFQ